MPARAGPCCFRSVRLQPGLACDIPFRPMTPHARQNRRAWDARVLRRAWHTEPATDKDFQNPLAAVDDCGWLGGNVHRRRVLCLAAGGGNRAPLLAAAGAAVTVVDVSPAMLD